MVRIAKWGGLVVDAVGRLRLMSVPLWKTSRGRTTLGSLGRVLFIMVAFVSPHLAYYVRDTYYASLTPELRQVRAAGVNPLLIEEAMETHVKECSPAIYRYLREQRLSVIFTDLPPDRQSQRVVTLFGSHIEVSRDLDPELSPKRGYHAALPPVARRLACVVAIARCLIHEGVHCQRMDASNLWSLIYQEYRYAFGILREERCAYAAEGALGFGVVQVRYRDVAEEQEVLLEGLLSRTAMGLLLIALGGVLVRWRAQAVDIPCRGAA